MDKKIIEEFIKNCTVEQLNLYRVDGKPLLHVLHLIGQRVLEQQLVSRGVDLNQRDTNDIDYIGLVNRWNRYVSVDVMGEIASFVPVEERQVVLTRVNKEFKSVIDKMKDFQNLSEAQIQKILDYLKNHDDIRSFEYVLERNMDPSRGPAAGVLRPSRGQLLVGADNWAIGLASQKGYLSVIDRLMQDERVDPSANDNLAIREASFRGHFAIVDRLMQDPRVDPSADDNYSIRLASLGGYLAIVERLLQDPRVDPSANRNEAIRWASKEGHLAVVERLLQDRRINPGAENNRAIQEASRNGHLAVVDRLLQDPRVDPSEWNSWGIRQASRYGHLAVVERLLQDPRVDPSARNNLAIREASENGHLAIVERLMEDPRVSKTFKK